MDIIVIGQRHSDAPSRFSNGFPKILSGAAMAASQQPHLVPHLVLDLSIISTSIKKSKSAAEIETVHCRQAADHQMRPPKVSEKGYATVDSRRLARSS